MTRKFLIIIQIVILCLFIRLFADDLVIHLTDPENDDHGAGYIKYPDNAMFTKGIFDITDFKLYSVNDKYKIEISFAGKIRPVIHSEFQYKYDLGDDFILPLIQIYIDADHKVNSGYTQTIAGANVQISEESAWEKCIMIGALPERYKNYLEAKQPELARRTYFPEKLNRSADNFKIIAYLDKNRLGKNWRTPQMVSFWQLLKNNFRDINKITFSIKRCITIQTRLI